MKSLAPVLLLASSALLSACGGATPPPAAPSATTAPAAGAPVVAPGDAKVGDKTTCPVSGEEFVVTAASPKVEYQGKTYFFCCSGCDKKFQADPQKYLSKPAG